MNKSESKYFNTAKLMDEAFIKILEKKDLPFITVKEICEKAGVNRSTFYLHYETINDLLVESVENLNNDFFTYMDNNIGKKAVNLHTDSNLELYFIKSEYLIPYLNYIKDNRKIYRLFSENYELLNSYNIYDKMFKNIFTPILFKYNVLEKDHKYIIRFCIDGISAIIKVWLENDCQDDIEYIVSLIQSHIPKPKK